MGTRLDRLITLLDTGSTPSVRLTAARQLGALAQVRVAHPSTNAHGHASVTQPKLEDGVDQGVWRGVDGEWNDVIALVARILPCLESRSSETRQAASAALSCISSSVGIWDPTLTAPSSTDDLPLSSSLPPSDSLSLSSFDLNKVLLEGTLLLSSSGKEYAKLSNLSKEELDKAQRDALGNLGLGLGAAESGMEDDLGINMKDELSEGVQVVEEKEKMAEATPLPSGKATLPPPKFANSPIESLKNSSPSTSAVARPIVSPSASPPPSSSDIVASTEADDPYAGLSARERNKLKRKRKSEAKSSSGPSAFSSSLSLPPAQKPKFDTPPAVKEEEDVKPALETSTETKGEMVVIDPGAKARERAEGGEVTVEGESGQQGLIRDLEVKVGEWPWRGTVERLAVALLSPNWEARHGASLGLREILKMQGSAGGKLAGLTPDVNEERHRVWTEDLAFKLLCVFALDRFGDYISDQVIAPVRETSAQALATLLPFMADSSVIQVQKILIAMIDQNGSPPSKGLDHSTTNGESRNAKGERGKYVWQVRHSGLLGLKYLVAVKGDLVRGGTVKVEDQREDVKMKVEEGDEKDFTLLRNVVEAALLGLRDRDDDVRSAASATLTPVTQALVKHLPKELKEVMTVLWECLGDLKDDLSSSIGGIMDLMANLLVYPPVIDLLQSPAMGHSLADLIPRLFPFFRHTITSVRLAVVNAIQVFLGISAVDHRTWVDDRLLRLLFQNLIVEERLEIRLATLRAWKSCLAIPNPEHLWGHANSHLEKWFAILSTQIGTPINTAHFWSAKASLSGQGGFVYNVDKAILKQDLALVSVQSIMRGRVAAAVALGSLMAAWSSTTRDASFGPLLKEGLSSDSALQRFLSATVIEEWATAAYSITPTPLPETSPLAAQLSQLVSGLLAADPPASYAEMATIVPRLQADCQALYAAFGKQGKVPANKLPAIASNFGILQAQQVAQSFNSLVPLMGKGLKKTVLPLLEEQHRKITSAIGYYEATKAKHDRQVFAGLGGAVIALRTIPAKLSPLIRSITSSIKGEEDIDLQGRAAHSIAAFIDYCSSPTSTVRTNPSDKLIKNLCTFLCQDVSRTPIFAGTKSSKRGVLTLEYKPARGVAVKEAKDAGGDSEEAAISKLVYRGAQMALSELAVRFGDSLLERVPKLWSCMSDALLSIFAGGEVSQADAIIGGDDQRGQDLLDCLTVLPTGAEKLSPSVRGRLTTLLPSLALASQSLYAVVRYSVARCFAALCDIISTEGLRQVVETVLPSMSDPLNVNNRRGAIEVVSHIVDLLDIKILPYVIFLVVPVLGRMSDPDDDVRLVATNTFATLIKLVPLEAALPDPPGFPAEMLAKREAEREFLTQLLDGNKVAEYKIPIPIGIELRKYQRDGVSWLAFLAKYQLHGLLCDDMGLGKTLQSICILASKHHERAEKHAATKSVDTVHLPSLVVCPPTLTGHWQQEIRTYAKALRPVVYTGSKAERERLVASLSRYDVVIMSYDILRNDIDSLGAVDWHYCILDEGHVIKNGKTKLTKAVKTVRSIHRLILSGTPIQNNVLELWSLFDFLMPGFLGSEKAFNERFGKPIAASRDAKSSSKEQEAGALALEALHKQVLPFLLRRLKEDVLDDLPPKIIQDYYCELSPLQKQLYDDFSSSQGKQVVEGAAAGKGQATHVFQALQYLRKLVNHPSLVIKPDVPQHQALLAKMAASGGALRDVANAPKLQALRQILLDCGIGTSSSGPDDNSDSVTQHRVLIFCQLKQMLDIVENDLFRALMPSVTYMRMDGGTDVSKRHAVVQTFNADPSIDCLLLTTHVGGLGLNLTGADTVIFVEHDWNPMKDLQAMDRAHRLGQKKVVNVYRLIMRGTLEEKIMGLQKFKLNIASSVVTQQNSDLASLGTDQILDLFNVSADDAPPAQVKDRPVGQKAILEELGDLPPEDEYNDLDFSSFTASLNA